MSTSSQQHRGGRRQPFGSLNANTIAAAKDAAVGADGGSIGASSAAAAAAGARSPMKSDPSSARKKKSRGSSTLPTIVTRSKSEKGASSSSSSLSGSVASSSRAEDKEMDAPSMESPKKKARGVVVSQTESAFAASRSDVASIFRRPFTGGAWDDELESMLELKPANPVVDNDDGSVGNGGDATGSKIDATEPLKKELDDENVRGEPILWSHRVKEDDKIGFKIHADL